MRVRLERIGTEDIAEINRIQKLAFRESYEMYRFCPAYEASDAEVAAFLHRADGYKILADDSIVGSVFICLVENDQYELNTITVHPDFQGKGIGDLAISLAEGFYLEDTRWILQTPEKDNRNRHLYEKHGYLESDSETINAYLTLITYKKQRKEAT